MSALLEDHGLPLVQLKEQRRDLIIALGRQGPLSAQQIAEIAYIQSAIAAIEAVVDDLDAEAEVLFQDRGNGPWQAALKP